MAVRKDTVSKKTKPSKNGKSKSKSRRRQGCCTDMSGDGVYDTFFRPVIAELVGTTIFVFLITMSMNAPNLLTTASVQGLGLSFLAVALGGVSGGHLNPAVTLATMIAGAMSVWLGIVYIIVQVAGGIGGAAITRAILTTAEYNSINGGNTALSASTSVVEGFVIEAILTFILVLVFTVAVLDYGAPAAPVAVGLVVLVDVIIGLDKTGASMNPARSVGPAVIQTFDSTDQWDDHWVYWVGPILGGVVAAVLYRFVLADPEHRKVCVEDRGFDEEDDTE